MAFTQEVRETSIQQAVLALLSGFVSVWAVAGAVGLAGGGIDLGAVVVERLPYDSPVLAGLALALVVAVPMALTSVLAARGDRRAPALAIGSGGLLIVWIVVQVSTIRTVSWLQPLCVVLGLAVLVLGVIWRPRPE
ncbi:hypothetical protein HLB23_05310 [Nocardia uniformis]|uniref:Uncharacterized protein n=1 Tax=Nocardia uniformis TaxID=53432 RepID=A0A849BRP9_9NOCA|nr:hypothetical protein [Nocardia uniformis]NNH69293.1 hypothetical protein [Nocardia uniformis]